MTAARGGRDREFGLTRPLEVGGRLELRLSPVGSRRLMPNEEEKTGRGLQLQLQMYMKFCGQERTDWRPEANDC
jgi:hypothetical protein